MTRFKIIHAFFLKSANKLMGIGTIFPTEDKDQLAELRTFAEQGACEEVVPAKAEAKAEPAVDPSDDISVVPGLGKTLLASLEEMAITKLSHLKAAMTDGTKEEKLREVLGAKFEKIQSYFQAA